MQEEIPLPPQAIPILLEAVPAGLDRGQRISFLLNQSAAAFVAIPLAELKQIKTEVAAYDSAELSSF